ncbi:Regulatory protein BlaR1, partial [Durusdinium trenchii]
PCFPNSTLSLPMAEFLAEIAWRQLWQITLVIPIVIWLTRRYCLRASHFAHALLMLVLLKCLLPPLVASPTGLFTWVALPSIVEPSGVEAEQITQLTPEKAQQLESHTERTATRPTAGETAPLGDAAATSGSVTESWLSSSLSTGILYTLGVIWIAGFLALWGYLIGKWLQFHRAHEDTSVPPSDELLDMVVTVSDRLDLPRVPQVLVTTHPTIPFANGTWDPRIVLPLELVESLPQEDLELVVAHELTHLRRGDMIAGALQTTAQLIWWFHPLVWWLNREIRRVREQCCDEQVVENLKCRPGRYARCLLNVLERQRQLRPHPELAGLSAYDVTANRLENIMRRDVPVSAGLSFGGWCLLMLLAVIILPGAGFARSAPVVIVEKQKPARTVSEDVVAPVPRPIAVTKETPVDDEAEPPDEPKPADTVTEKPDESVTDAPSFSSEPTRPGTMPRQQARVPSNEQSLRYGWQAGASYGYRVTIEAEFPHETEKHTGSPRFPWCVRLPIRVSSQKEVEDLPYFLGTLTNLVFPRVVSDVFAGVERTGTTTLSLKEYENDYSPFAEQREVERLAAEYREQLQATRSDGSQIELNRSYRVSTVQKVDGEPRFETTFAGRLQWSEEEGLPLRATYTGRTYWRDERTELRIPLTIQIERLTDSPAEPDAEASKQKSSDKAG